MLPIDHPKVEEVIRILREEIQVDGETMQHILRETTMEHQMYNQLKEQIMKAFYDGLEAFPAKKHLDYNHNNKDIANSQPPSFLSEFKGNI